MRAAPSNCDFDMYGISRIDDSKNRAHRWRVSIRRRGKRYIENFPDKQCGGQAKALLLAKQYRNHILQMHPPISRREFSDSPRRNNTSGVTGVYFVSTVRIRNDRAWKLEYWEAIWPTVPGKRRTKKFSVSTYGFDGAFELACKARSLGLGGVSGVFWPTVLSLNPVFHQAKGSAEDTTCPD